MRGAALRTGLAALCAVALLAAPAAADPVSFEHGTLDQRFTTTKPNRPSGFAFDGRYHAAGDPDARPPYMRKMIFYNTMGLRYDTSVPERCAASDLELATRGAAACPDGSRLGGGVSETSFGDGPSQPTELDFVNNTNEQIIVARSPFVATVARGRIFPDGSVEFASPTCWPTVGSLQCPVDTVLQIASQMRVAPYVRTEGGVTRSYMTTPAKCPKRGRWRAPIAFWWADGAEETVVAEMPCRRPKAKRRRARR